MIDLGEFTPPGQTDPVRLSNGTVQLGRPTSTTEQRTMAIAHMKDSLVDMGLREGKARIVWSRHEPTILELRIRIEHVTVTDEDEYGKPVETKIPVGVPDREVEYTLAGAEIHQTRAQRATQLNEEVTELERSGYFK